MKYPEKQAAAGDRDAARLESALGGGSVASIVQKDPTLDFLGNNIIVDNYNSLSRLKESKTKMVEDEDGQLVSEYHIKYQQRPNKKRRPVAIIGQNGEFKTIQVKKDHENDFLFDKPIDKFFEDHNVNRLIYETRLEQDRYK